MSLIRSMTSAVNGLGSHADAMDVVSDNIANVNTIGFKAGRGRFEDVLGNTVAHATVYGGAGNGSRLADVSQVFTQGSLLGTGVATDLAIQGDGFFILRGALRGVDSTYYSRMGQLEIDRDGFMLDPNGLNVQGYNVLPNGQLSAQVDDLQLPVSQAIPPRATQEINIAANLDATEAVIAAPFDPNDLENTANHTASVVVYDSLGTPRTLNIAYRVTGAGTWEWNVVADGADVVGGTPGVAQVVANGTLTFDTNGALNAQATAANTVDFVGATPGQVLTFDFGDDITSGGTGLQGVTQFASESTNIVNNQDGYGSSSLAGIEVGEDGILTGTFTNGERRVLGQLALARFPNNQGLARSGSGTFIATLEAGEPAIGAAGSGGRGAIAAEALEQSNVDLAQEFVNMIVYQRGFQANSRAIQTADEMLAELNTLKR